MTYYHGKYKTKIYFHIFFSRGETMKLVKHILETKGGDIWHIEPGESVLDAIKIMAEKRIGALLVMEDERLVGIRFRTRLCPESYLTRKIFA